MSITAGRPSKEEFEEIVVIKKLADPAFAEKDWFVTQVIRTINQVEFEGFHIAFSGGTALAKAYHQIERFSEDIDFVVEGKDDLNERERSSYKRGLIEKLRQDGLSIQDQQVKTSDKSRYFVIEMDYETYFDRPSNLRPHIKIEFVMKKPRMPLSIRSVASFFTEISGRVPEVEKIGCVQPVEIAADKLSALTWRVNERNRGSANDDPSIVRHLHDLAKLKELIIVSPDFSAMAKDSIKNDELRSRDPAFKEKSLIEKLNIMITKFKQDELYQDEYNRFVGAMSYALSDDQIPNFNTALSALEELIGKVTSF